MFYVKIFVHFDGRLITDAGEESSSADEADIKAEGLPQRTTRSATKKAAAAAKVEPLDFDIVRVLYSCADGH